MERLVDSGSWPSLQGTSLSSWAHRHPYLLNKEGRWFIPGLVEQMQTVCPELLPCPYLAQLGRRKPSSLLRTQNLSAEPTAAAASWSLTLEAASAFGFSLVPRPLLCSVSCCVFLPHLGVVGNRKMKCFCRAPNPSCSAPPPTLKLLMVRTCGFQPYS